MRQNNSENGSRKNISALKTREEKKAQYVPTRPSDTDMHQDNTNVSPTLDKSLLCASLKTNFFCRYKCYRGTKSCSNCLKEQITNLTRRLRVIRDLLLKQRAQFHQCALADTRGL